MADSRSQDDFAHAVHLHRQGRLVEAINSYRNVVRANPRHAEALNLLGLAHFAHGEPKEAIASLRKALALQPDLPGGYFNLGQILQGQGQIADAVAQYEKAVALKPDDVEAHLRLGHLLPTQDRPAEALPHFECAVAIAPNNAEARVNLGVTFNALERPADAITQFEAALALNRDNVEAHHNLGVALLALNRSAEAITHYERVIGLKPDLPQAHMNLGNALHNLNRDAEAAPHYERALALRADYAEAHMNFASSLQALGSHDDALSHFDKALALRPDSAAIKFNKAMLCLALQRFDEGWPLYEERWAAVTANKPRRYSWPRWDGRKTGTLLVWAEQGLGDQILHAGMIPELTPLADRIVFEVEPRLVELFARSFPGIDVIALRDDLYSGHADAQVALGSLGRFLRPRLESFPRRQYGYLVSDAVRVAGLHERLHRDQRAVVGLSWISHNPRSGLSKSAKLRDFEAILQLPNCRFVDLQYGDTAVERAEIERELGVAVERLADIDNTNDIDGLAALIGACDAAVSVSNTTAHLAGALGTPTWTFVPHGHARIWYWFKHGEDSPWYPRVRVRRQAERQPWRGLVASIVGELSALLRPGASRP